MKRILLALMIGAVFILAGFSLFVHYRVRQAMAQLHYEAGVMADEIAGLTAAAAVLEGENDALNRQMESEKADLDRQIRDLSTQANPFLQRHGLYASEVREMFLADEDFHAEMAEIAGLWPPLVLTPLTVTDNYVLFPQGLVSFSFDQGEIVWSLEAYRLAWMGWRHVREAPTPRRLTDLETVTIRRYSVDDGMRAYPQSILEIPGEDLWHEVTQGGIRDVWYVADTLYVDLHPRMEMAFNIGLGSLGGADAFIRTMFSLPGVANVVFLLDGGPMMHGYLGFCLNERRFLWSEVRFARISGYVAAAPADLAFADWAQAALETDAGPVEIIVTARTVFTHGVFEIGEYVTVFYHARGGDEEMPRMAGAIALGGAGGLYVNHFVEGMGVLEGSYISVDKDFVFNLEPHTAVRENPVQSYGPWGHWRHGEDAGLHDMGLAVIYSRPTRVNGRLHAVAEEVFVLNHMLRDFHFESAAVPDTFRLSAFELVDRPIYVQGVRVDAPPVFMYEGTVMLPVRPIMERLSASFDFRAVSGESGALGLGFWFQCEPDWERWAEVQFGRRLVRANAQENFYLAAPAMIVDGVAYISVEFFQGMVGFLPYDAVVEDDAIVITPR